MSEIKIQLKGIHAVIALVALAGFFGYKYYNVQTTLDTEGAEVLKNFIRGDYLSHAMIGIQATDFKAGNIEDIEKKVQKVLGAGKIDFFSLKARGTSNDIIVRAEISVNGKPPETGKAVRYFRMEYYTITGHWRVHREVTAFSYHSKFF